MEKTVLKTLIYADIFDIPLRAWEIQKWSIKKQIGLKDVESTLKRLMKKSKVQSKKGYYFLTGRGKLVNPRIKSQKLSNEILQNLKLQVLIFRLIPWIKLVGVRGSLAVHNINPKDNIELVMIITKNRLWISRLLIKGILMILNTVNFVLDVTRKKINFSLLAEDHLELEIKNLFTAHEVLETKVLWQKAETYSKFLESNAWVFDFLPSWATSKGEKLKLKRKTEHQLWLVNALENFAKKIQGNNIENIYASNEYIEVMKIFNGKVRQL